MRWPPWTTDPPPSPPSLPLETPPSKKSKPIQWTDSLNATDWSHYTDPRTVVPTLILTTSILVAVRLYRSYLRRIPEAASIQPGFFRRRSLLGRVTSVGDGDNFRLFHTPGGRLAGWEWMPGRRVPTKREELKDRTIHVRLAGIDAPELAHFGRPSQPYSAEAFDWLKSYILNRRVRAYIYRRDQYDRVVATVFVRRWLIFRRDVGHEMLRRGFATVYEAKSGAEYGSLGVEAAYRRTEAWAKRKRRGMWAGKEKDYESPMAYKKRMKVGEEK